MQHFAKAGDVKWRDVNGDDKIDAADRTIIGNPFPDFIFGMTNTFSWKGFELSILINGTKVYSKAKMPLHWMNNMNGNLTQHAMLGRRWRSEEDPGDGLIGRAILNNRNGSPDQFSTFYVEYASFIRIRSVNLAYNLPASWLSCLHLKGARLYIMGANLHTYTKYRGFDPETNDRGNSAISQGVDMGGYPLARSIQFGINLNF